MKNIVLLLLLTTIPTAQGIDHLLARGLLFGAGIMASMISSTLYSDLNTITHRVQNILKRVKASNVTRNEAEKELLNTASETPEELSLANQTEDDLNIQYTSALRELSNENMRYQKNALTHSLERARIADAYYNTLRISGKLTAASLFFSSVFLPQNFIHASGLATIVAVPAYAVAKNLFSFCLAEKPKTQEAKAILSINRSNIVMQSMYLTLSALYVLNNY
jgi:hypothetical protein